MPPNNIDNNKITDASVVPKIQGNKITDIYLDCAAEQNEQHCDLRCMVKGNLPSFKSLRKNALTKILGVRRELSNQGGQKS